MKIKIIFLSFLALLIMPSTRSQVLIGLLFGDKLNNDRMEFGFNVGSNIGTISGVEGSKFSSNLCIGLFLDYKISDRWILNTSFLFSSKRGVRNFGPNDQFYPLPDTITADYDSYRILRYIELPVMMSYRFTKKLGVGLGLDFGYMRKAQDFYSEDNANGTIYVSHDIKSFINRFHFGVMAGLHYRFKGDPGAQIRVNYIHGLTNVYRQEYDRTGYHRSVQISVTIPIKFGISKLKEQEDS